MTRKDSSLFKIKNSSSTFIRSLRAKNAGMPPLKIAGIENPVGRFNYLQVKKKIVAFSISVFKMIIGSF
jgi:hypothetical protein